MSQDEIIAAIVEAGGKITGSHYVGGVHDGSDIDYFISDWMMPGLNLRSLGFSEDPLHYMGIDDFVSLRHDSLPLNLIVMNDDYFPIYDEANDNVHAMKGHLDLSTREGRVKWFKHFIAVARLKAATGCDSQLTTS